MYYRFKISDFIYNVNELIEKKSLTNKELVKLTGLPTGTLSEVINGYINPSVNHLTGLARAFNVKIEDLIKPICEG